MIDRESRNKLAELIRSLATGQISNDQFEDSIPNSSDSAIGEVYSNGAWQLYSDFHQHKLKGREALTKEDKHLVSRWVLFLKTSNEYEWPSMTFSESLLCIVTLGIWRKRIKIKWKKTGDIEFWPFTNKIQLEIAKSNNGYLGANNT